MPTSTASTKNYIITCAAGLENSLIIELASFGIEGTFLQVGRVSVSLTLAQFYHVCLWSRVASRVLLPLFSVPVKQLKGHEVDHAEQLFMAASGFDWSLVFNVNQSFVVKLSADKSVNLNQQFATLRVKDAIVDSFVEATGKRPNVERDAQNNIQVNISKEGGRESKRLVMHFYLDLTGTSLHRRGYRHSMTDAPLKENLAAALLYQTGWHTCNADNEDNQFNAIFDPMCGSGTLITEALLMWTDYAVGGDKDFAFVNWNLHNEELWQQTLEQAQEKHELAMTKPMPKVIGYDASLHAIKATHQNLVVAGFGEQATKFTLEQRSLAQWATQESNQVVVDKLAGTKPLTIVNPPYGERLGEKDTTKSLYQALGLNLQAAVPNQHAAVVAAVVEDADALPFADPQTLRTHNGQLTIYLRQGTVKPNTTQNIIQSWVKEPVEFEAAQDLVNRLQKNLQNLKKLAKREGVVNLRVYDADLPNYNLAVDVYGEFIHVQEYAAPKKIDAEKAKQNFNTALQAIRLVFDVSRDKVFIKTRRKQKGTDQYEKTSNKGKFHITTEGNGRFYINLSDYLDTGLFLDHRPIRTIIGEESRGKNVLNLYAYTCTASVHAAVNGAKSVTSVDLSNTYLDWGKRNFAVNGLIADADNYNFIYADVFDWLKGSEVDEQFDIIFIDPPTFSNSKKFYGTFDVQRDHVSLINRAVNRLASGGVIYFSNNYRGFELDEQILQRYTVTEMTNKTIGFDFKRKDGKTIHKCWKIEFK